MLQNQLRSGNFAYEYDWKAKTFSADDNQVRQAGALWGLALLYLYNPQEEIAQATLRAFKFFEDISKLTEQDQRYVIYPREPGGKTGTIALITLAYIDFLRAAAATLPAAEMAKHRRLMDQYIKMLIRLRRADGLWYGGYSYTNGLPIGAPSSYSDGEALLALTKAARFYARTELKDIILNSAMTGIKVNIEDALREDPDSAITKGYYQWSSMAFFEINQIGWDPDDKYASQTIKLADWMIDVHRTLERAKNTAYAYEGLIHAYQLALNRDKDKAQKIGCVIEKGLERLTSWQIGHSFANSYVALASLDDSKAVGGVQNSANEPSLRIDVAQHQMHALNLALRYYYNSGM